MRVVITGGLGFVGGNLAQAMNRAGGYEVTLFDDQSLGRPDFVADLDVAVVKGDIRDAAALAAVLAGADAVVHLAADTRVIPSVADPAHNWDVNVRGSFILLEAMRAAGVGRLVNASTGGAIVGEAPPPVHEGIAPAPLSPYGASKLAVEGYCSAYGASYGMACASLRFSNVYGPRSFHKGSVVAAFCRAILGGRPLDIHGDGQQTRDYVYVGDLCDGILAALAGDATGPIQLGTGVPTPLLHLVDRLRAVTGRPVEVIHHPARAGEVRHTHGRIDRARALLGYEPRTSLDEGLAATWAWFRAHADRFAG